jgi:hypothetical protein
MRIKVNCESLDFFLTLLPDKVSSRKLVLAYPDLIAAKVTSSTNLSTDHPCYKYAVPPHLFKPLADTVSEMWVKLIPHQYGIARICRFISVF